MSNDYIYSLIKSSLQDKLIKNLKKDKDFKDKDLNELIERRVNIILNGDNFEDILISTSKKKSSNIIKKDKSDKVNKPIDPNKCQCRVWNHGWSRQCGSNKVDGHDFCKKHMDGAIIISGKNKGGVNEFPRLCGIITEPRPDKRPDNGIAHGWRDIKDKR